MFQRVSQTPEQRYGCEEAGVSKRRRRAPAHRKTALYCAGDFRLMFLQRQLPNLAHQSAFTLTLRKYAR